MPRLRDTTKPLAVLPAVNDPALALLGSFWIPDRIDYLRRMKRAKLLPSAMARRLGTTPGDVRRALQALGLEAPMPDRLDTAKLALERRLLALASPTGHAVSDLARFGVVVEAVDVAV